MKTLTYTEAKELMKLTDRETVEAFAEEEHNFNDTYRIYTEEEALAEVVDMYEWDPYMLGCFNNDFISDYIDLDSEDINLIQESEHFDIVGKLILNSGNLEEMIKEYIRLDGYGHALNSYDGNWEEYKNYIIIRTN